MNQSMSGAAPEVLQYPRRREAPGGELIGVEVKYDRACVITVSHNNLRSLDDYIDGLAAQGDSVGEVVVVDNGSVDGTPERLRNLASQLLCPVKVIESGNIGFSAGMNLAAAARETSGVPLACVNPDLKLGVGILTAMLEALNESPQFGIITAPLIDQTGKPDSASIRTLPALGNSVAYAILGRLQPRRYRYNGRSLSQTTSMEESTASSFPIEATTGALMILNPSFRSTGEVFDPDYWMYGEDLQLCSDAKESGFGVLMLNGTPSVHSKGMSSGRPRRLRSNWAFHNAMYVYYKKNLNKYRVMVPLFLAAVISRFLVSAAASAVVRVTRGPQSSDTSNAPS